jgi:WD40 repeat protein
MVWDMHGKPIATLEHGWLVNVAAFACDHTHVLTADRHGTARLWNPDTGAVQLLEGHRKSINSARFDRDCTRVVTASDDDTARIWSTATGGTIAELTGHTGPVLDARFSPDGTSVVTASSDGKAIVWAADTGVMLTTPFQHAARLRDAVLSPEGHCLITVGDGGTARWWNVDTHESRELGGHSNLVGALDVSPRGQWVVTAGSDGVARIWSAATGAPLAALRGHKGPITSAAFSPDGNYVVTASADGSARVWAVGTDDGDYQFPELTAADAAPYSIAFTPDGTSVLGGMQYGAGDGEIVTWATGAQEPSSWKASFDGIVHQVSLSADGAFLIAAVEGGGAHVFQRDGDRWTEATQPIDESAVAISAAISADGLTAGTAVNKQPARLWKRSVGERAWQQDVAVELPLARAIALDTDSETQHQHLVLAGDESAIVLDLSGGQEPIRFVGHQKALNSARLNARGTLLVTASDDATARIWDVKTRATLQTLSLAGPVQQAVFSSDGEWVATAAGDRVHVWDVATGAHLGDVGGHGPARSIAFSPHDRLLAVASGDKTVRLYEWEAFAPHSALLLEVARRQISPLSPDERKGYLAGSTGASGQLLAQLFRPTP